MYTLSTSKFETHINEMFDRFTDGGGFLKGDVVKLKKSATSSDWFKQQASSVQDKLQQMIEKSNRVYRISALKSEIPRSAGSFGMGQPIAAVADVVREVNPSFWMDPVTVPLQYLEVVDVGVNMPPYDKDLIRPDNSNIKPTDSIENTDKVSSNQTMGGTDDRVLYNKYESIKYGNKWDDKKPGGGNIPSQFLKRDRRQIKH